MIQCSQMLLCGVTAELFERGPPEDILEEPGDPPVMPFRTPILSVRFESAIPVNLRFQFWIIVDAGLAPDFTRFVSVLADDLSSGNFEVAGGETGLVDDLGIGGEGLEMRAVFTAVVLAASSAACLSAFCCLKILSTTYLPTSIPPCV